MLTLIIFSILKKCMPPNLTAPFFKTATLLKIFVTKILIRLSIKLITFLPIISLAQSEQLDYNIMFNGTTIGWLKLEKNEVGNKSNLQLTSEIKTNILFPIKVFSKETSTYENGKLIYSSQFRKTNGKTKIDKEIKLHENQYEIIENNKKTKLSYPVIDTNLLSLFFQEPKCTKEVYCDNQQRFIKPIKMDDGGYKMKFPNGNCNSYYYKEGICIKVKVEHKFYEAEIIIKR